MPRSAFVFTCTLKLGSALAAEGFWRTEADFTGKRYVQVDEDRITSLSPKKWKARPELRNTGR